MTDEPAPLRPKEDAYLTLRLGHLEVFLDDLDRALAVLRQDGHEATITANNLVGESAHQFSRFSSRQMQDVELTRAGMPLVNVRLGKHSASIRVIGVTAKTTALAKQLESVFEPCRNSWPTRRKTLIVTALTATVMLLLVVLFLAFVASKHVPLVLTSGVPAIFIGAILTACLPHPGESARIVPTTHQAAKDQRLTWRQTLVVAGLTTFGLSMVGAAIALIRKLT